MKNDTDILTPSEQQKLDRFQTLHLVTCHGSISVEFFRTGIGTNVTVTCSGCARSEDITDYSVW